MISGVYDGDVAVVTKALDVLSQAIDSIKEALKLMHGNAVVIMKSCATLGVDKGSFLT